MNRFKSVPSLPYDPQQNAKNVNRGVTRVEAIKYRFRAGSRAASVCTIEKKLLRLELRTRSYLGIWTDSTTEVATTT